MISLKVLILVECLLLTTATRLSDRQSFGPSAFKFDMLGAPASQSSAGGTIRRALISEMPVLAGEGLGFTLFTIKPCGINEPHVHPRASEILYVIQGRSLRVGFVEENTGRTIINDLQAGQVTVFPQGLLHYQQNLGCEEAQYISAFNSEDPGVQGVSRALFGLPLEGVASALNMDEADVLTTKSNIPANPAKGRIECLKRCGIFKSDKQVVFKK